MFKRLQIPVSTAGALLLCALGDVGCGGGSSPSNPDASQPPGGDAAVDAAPIPDKQPDAGPDYRQRPRGSWHNLDRTIDPLQQVLEVELRGQA